MSTVRTSAQCCCRAFILILTNDKFVNTKYIKSVQQNNLCNVYICIVLT